MGLDLCTYFQDGLTDQQRIVVAVALMLLGVAMTYQALVHLYAGRYLVTVVLVLATFAVTHIAVSIFIYGSPSRLICFASGTAAPPLLMHESAVAGGLGRVGEHVRSDPRVRLPVGRALWQLPIKQPVACDDEQGIRPSVGRRGFWAMCFVFLACICFSIDRRWCELAGAGSVALGVIILLVTLYQVTG